LFKKLRQEEEERITVARSRNHSCGGEARSITHSECGFLALIIRHDLRKEVAEHMSFDFLQKSV
jgi:hypothetical protein